MQIIEIAQASGPQLLAFFNANASRVPDVKPVKKWSDMSAARRRTGLLVEKLASYIDGGKEGVDFPPEGCVMFAEEGDDLTEAVATEDYSTSTKVEALEVPEGDATEEEEVEEASAFGAMASGLNGIGEKAPAATPTRTNSRASNSAGVARSWTDEKVRTARLTRDGVRVTHDGSSEDFKSTREAWNANRLPAGKHIRFRLKLKELRSLEYKTADGEVYLFEMVEIEE